MWAGREEMRSSSLYLTMECLDPAGLALRCTHMAGDGRYDLDGFPAIGRSLRRVTAPDHIQIATTSAYCEPGQDRLLLVQPLRPRQI